ncbi:phage major capsid protein [Methylomonas sp. MgM2]
MSLQKITTQIDRIERDINNHHNLSKNELENIGSAQLELGRRLAALERRGVQAHFANRSDWGTQIVASSVLREFLNGGRQKAKFEIKNNTLTGGDSTVAPDRKPGVVPGAFSPMTLESLFPAMPTAENAIEFTRELLFTNSAAETAEGSAKSESSLTFELVNMPVSTVAHWIKISKQLASDAPALAAYVNLRMEYGVNRRIETQLAVGNGTAPNISGIFDTGNYQPHGYTAAQLTTSLPKHELIRRCMTDLFSAGYRPSAILLNPADWLQFELSILNSTPSYSASDLINGLEAKLFGVPVVQSLGVTADTFGVGAFAMSGNIRNREDVTIEMSESDSDNFTKNLITVRAERRLALAIEQPSAIIGGDLTPA